MYDICSGFRSNFSVVSLPTGRAESKDSETPLFVLMCIKEFSICCHLCSGTKNPEKPADPIIVHPDVRRMLLTQKCIAEGGRAMIYECALLADLMKEAEARGDKETAKLIDDDMGLLTPILKGFLTETGVEAANLGIQVYGGHGYVKENKQEQVCTEKSNHHTEVERQSPPPPPGLSRMCMRNNQV